MGGIGTGIKFTGNLIMKLLTQIAMVVVGVPTLAVLGSMVLSGCAVNGRPMRCDPASNKKSLSWYIEGKAKNNKTISCSFVEFDERGDFIDFQQHQDCENRIKKLVASGPVLLVMYCHGWKNNSQSEDVLKFNSFLAKIAASPEVVESGYRVHGVYLSWRGNVVQPFIDKSDEFYRACTNYFGEPIVDEKYDRKANWTGFIPENVDFFTRQRAAEHLVSGLPIARAIFTYASAAKDYGSKLTNQVIVMGHSMGALMLERSLGQAMTGSLVMEWWQGLKNNGSQQAPVLPFDFILFMNSAAPSIYAKEMRDFLEANRAALHYSGTNDYPVIVSLTSTADSATGVAYPLAHCLCPLKLSLQRKYTTGIFGTNGQDHAGIRQWKFYLRTPGHQPYLVNHWIIPETGMAPLRELSSDQVFATNISRKTVHDPYVFYTATAGKKPAATWRITNKSPGTPVTLDGLPLAMQSSDYWIINCGKALIASHDDVWSTADMEMYAGLYRLAAYLKKHPQNSVSNLPPAKNNLAGSQSP